MVVAATKTLACVAIAMAGMTAYHHCLVRHQMRATATTQTPMMISVVPMCYHTAVIEIHVDVRAEARDRLMLSSDLRPPSGPMMRKPRPTIAPNRTTAG